VLWHLRRLQCPPSPQGRRRVWKLGQGRRRGHHPASGHERRRCHYYIGQPIHVATLYNNLCRHSLASRFERTSHGNPRREINEAWPRLGWCS
ncbi:cyanamide hydratase family HD domain-containing protein, partial [Colletotrichum tamarilloi]